MADRRVFYVYHNEIGNFHYSENHPMKPQRIRIVHNLVLGYGLYKNMDLGTPEKATYRDLIKFHNKNYINFVRSANVSNVHAMGNKLAQFNVCEDCPMFLGLYDYIGITAGGSLMCAKQINYGECDIAINWAGGLHHAKHAKASGFCYVNDIVLAILELARHNKRVMYIDIDVHHGDGVEEAFYTTDRVMTLSFHRYGEYFPGSGNIDDIGIGQGKGYAVNVPLKNWIDDESYIRMFKPVVERSVAAFCPDVIVLQCGADSLAGDLLGKFNLTEKGHCAAVSFVKSFGIPMLVLGGGGYTLRNVCRCWTNETAALIGQEIPLELPNTEYREIFAPDYTIEIHKLRMENENSRRYLEDVVQKVSENIRENVKTAPSVEILFQPEGWKETAVSFKTLKRTQSAADGEERKG